jgi:hypothetical protein
MPPARAAVRPRNSPDRIDARPAARDGTRQEFAPDRECPDVRFERRGLSNERGKGGEQKDRASSRSQSDRLSVGRGASHAGRAARDVQHVRPSYARERLWHQVGGTNWRQASAGVCRMQSGAGSQRPDDRQRDEPHSGGAHPLQQGRIGPQSCLQQQGAWGRPRQSHRHQAAPIRCCYPRISRADGPTRSFRNWQRLGVAACFGIARGGSHPRRQPGNFGSLASRASGMQRCARHRGNEGRACSRRTPCRPQSRSDSDRTSAGNSRSLGSALPCNTCRRHCRNRTATSTRHLSQSLPPRWHSKSRRSLCVRAGTHADIPKRRTQ